MSVPFINRRMKHLCAQFADNTPMLYADELYFRKPPELMNNLVSVSNSVQNQS
jgi:hypothetical protein